MSKPNEILKKFNSDFVELTHELRFKNEDLHLLPGDVKILREKLFTEALQALHAVTIAALPDAKEFSQPVFEFIKFTKLIESLADDTAFNSKWEMREVAEEIAQAYLDQVKAKLDELYGVKK